MASRAPTVRAAFNVESLKDLAGSDAGASIPGVHVPIKGAELPDPNLFWAGLVRMRENGFMLVVPTEELVHQAILDLQPADVVDEPPVFFQGSVTLVNTRGRELGTVDAELVDLPWAYAPLLFPAMQFRGGLAAQFKVTGFSFRGTNGRPSRASSDALAEAWINEMDPATAQEYLSLEELPEGEESDGQAEAPTGQTEPDVVSQLQARIIQLEGLLQNANQPNPRVLRSVGEPKAQSGAPAPKAPGLFQGAQSSQLTPQDWARLQSLAGSPPPRVAGVERRRPDPPAVQKLQENLYADLEKEAVEDEVSLALKPLEGQLNESSLDPMQQMVLAQLRQNQLLLQKLIGNKPQDPVMRVLGSSGSDSGGGSSGGGVKGCLAREAFIHAIQDLPEVSRVVRRAALRELGLSSDREDGNLMRKYMERRIPLADHRLLAQFACLISEGWAVGYEAGNEQMLGTLGRMMIFVEQCALDSGRSQLAWLLTGLQDPPMHLFVSHRKRPGLEPFSRLSSPAWVSGNLAYLKDLDYIEGRMNSIGKNPKGQASEDSEVLVRPKPKPRLKGKGKGKAQSAQEGETAE